MHYIPPPTKPVLDSASATHFIPREWSNFYGVFSPPGFASQGTLFVHEMKKPNGERRLVAIDITNWNTTNGAATWESIRVFVPGSLFSSPRELTTDIQGELSLHPDSSTPQVKIFAGVIDPADPTHFTFQFIISGRCAMYDGWLQNDDQVVIGARK